MPSISSEIIIEAPQKIVWDVVGGFANGPQRFAPGILVDCRVDETGVRTITFADGTAARERLIARDEQARRIVWGWLADEVVHDNTSMQVFAQGEAQSRLVWIHDTLPDELTGWLATAMDQLAPVFHHAFKNRR